MITMQSGSAASASRKWLSICSGSQPEYCSTRSATPNACGRGARAVGARQGGAVARIAAHLHVDRHALAERLLRRRRSGGHGHERQGRRNVTSRQVFVMLASL